VSAKAVLKDPLLTSSVALAAVTKLLGPTVKAWEPETIRIELGRREINADEGLMAKVLSAITISTNTSWTYDHDVLFAFAVACCGVPSDSEALHHPTPEQLCWAMREITALTSARITDDEGFDPDSIDPAIAAVLHGDGFVLAPDELSFVQDVLDTMNANGHDSSLRNAVKAAWKDLAQFSTDTVRRRFDQLGETAQDIQLRRLGDCKLYVAEHELRRATQHALLNE
jgi:hypothetical protein